jgi:hypothetical protein
MQYGQRTSFSAMMCVVLPNHHWPLLLFPFAATIGNAPNYPLRALSTGQFPRDQSRVWLQNPLRALGDRHVQILFPSDGVCAMHLGADEFKAVAQFRNGNSVVENVVSTQKVA